MAHPLVRELRLRHLVQAYPAIVQGFEQGDKVALKSSDTCDNFPSVNL
jgi:hypothetical protein